MKFLNSLIQNQKLINLSYFIFIFTPIHLFFTFYILKILFVNQNRYSNAYKYLLDKFDNTPYYDIGLNNNNNSLNYNYPLKFNIFDQNIIKKKDIYYNNSFLTNLYNHQYMDYIPYVISNDEECKGYKKKCGIFDTTNNILCLPLNEKCPINDIMIGNKKSFNNNKIHNIKYNEYKLTDDLSLYYTNEAINNSIIVDLLLSENGICAYPINRTGEKNGMFEHYCDQRILGKYKYNLNYKKVNFDINKEEKYDLFVSNYIGVKKKCSSSLNGKKFIKSIKDIKNKNQFSNNFYFLFIVQFLFALVIILHYLCEIKFKCFFFKISGNVFKIFLFFFNCLIFIVLLYFDLFNIYKIEAKKYYNCSDSITNEIIKESFQIPFLIIFLFFTQFFVLILSNLFLFLNLLEKAMYHELPTNENDTSKIKYNRIVEITTLKKANNY